MSAVLDFAEPAEADFVDENPFFAPASSDMVDGLIGQYQHARAGIAELAAVMRDHIESKNSVLHYFLEGNRSEERGRHGLQLSAAQLFDEAGAVSALTSAFWSKALALTDVLDLMPQKRRDDWHKSISNPAGISARGSRHSDTPEWEVEPLPEFTEGTVRSTVMELLNMRSLFLAERVDGIFRGLSGEHLTNAPQGFGKRMIISHVLNEHHYSDHSRTGLINDLRCVIAKFMGRDEPKHWVSGRLVDALKGRWGEWVSVDGGALRIRLYKKGTAHLEVHPDMAWRLNMILAHLYPLAIPAQFRQRPTRQTKTVERILRPLPFAVLEILAGMKEGADYSGDPWNMKRRNVRNTRAFEHVDRDKHAKAEARSVIEAVGGVWNKERRWFDFDYEPSEVLAEIVTSGCIPDQKSHQFYPTRERMGRMAVDLAGIEEGQSVLEPSAGIGGLADLLPRESTTCVEVSALHSKILSAKGHRVECADFLQWSQGPGLRGTFDRIVMNPPFDRGQWVAHVERAAPLLSAGGRLVAILPSGARGREILPSLTKQWHGPFNDEFAGVGVSVVVLVAEAP